ncbi:hypothetical protein Mgra_00008065 [Meloidogyne graminicola]|uniref:C2H2-type domain-containing protein n=1 Tax=Meloidogyne graminicola TaxID=189291 RepID=A0A8S9ZGU6_9BILA|nr:hypothetical protein Mgra_00008065 [Meloidogyne graminicola]
MNLTEFDYDTFYSFNNFFDQPSEENDDQFADIIPSQLITYEHSLQDPLFSLPTILTKNTNQSTDSLDEIINTANLQPLHELICKGCGFNFLEKEAFNSHSEHCCLDKAIVPNFEEPVSNESPKTSINNISEQTLPNSQQPIVNCSSLPIRIQCRLCGRHLYQHNLAVHNRIHTGEMPFKCSYCCRPFRTKSALRVHNRSHTGERPYTCPFCCYACITKPNLQRHITNKHDKESGRTVKLCALRNWR